MPRDIPTPFQLAYLRQFVGKTITCVEFVAANGDLHQHLNFPDGDFAIVWCDPENNGPGHLSLYDREGTEIIPDDSTS